MRKCNKCNQTLTISDNWSLSMEKNHLYTCKPCWSKRAKSYYKKNKPTILEQQKELYHTSYKHDEEKLQKYRDYDKVWASKQRKKIYDSKLLEGNKGGDWVYYECKFTHKSLGFTFYKFGITQHGINYRYRNYLDYNIKVLKEEVGNKSYIKAVESKTKHNTKHLSFTFPKEINFSGYTECRQYL